MFCPKCGKLMSERDCDFYCMKDDVLIDKKTGKEVTVEDLTPNLSAHLKRLSQELRQRLVKYYRGLYIDGYAYLEVDECFIYLFEDFVRVSIGTSQPTFEFNLNYVDIESLIVTQEREITALRTYLLGPALAALFKKRTLILNVGFTDSLGLRETPSFRLAKDDLDDCYRLIMEQIAKSKGKSLREIEEHGGKHHPDFGR